MLRALLAKSTPIWNITLTTEQRKNNAGNFNGWFYHASHPRDVLCRDPPRYQIKSQSCSPLQKSNVFIGEQYLFGTWRTELSKGGNKISLSANTHVGKYHLRTSCEWDTHALHSHLLVQDFESYTSRTKLVALLTKWTTNSGTHHTRCFWQWCLTITLMVRCGQHSQPYYPFWWSVRESFTVNRSQKIYEWAKAKTSEWGTLLIVHKRNEKQLHQACF